MKRVFISILILMCAVLMCAAAQAEEIRPKAPNIENVDLENGSFNVKITDTSKIGNGFFTLGLYEEYRYYARQIEALSSGDIVYLNRIPYTVKEVVVREEKADYEIIPEEEFYGYIAFWKQKDGFYIAVIDDWVPCMEVAETEIALPLPDAFVLRTISAGGADETLYSAEEFITALKNGESITEFNQYNATASFENGLLVEINASSYPEGPGETEGTPLCELYGVDREALRDAVITCSKIGEAGLEETELSKAEQESIRRLAMNGKMTGKANETNVTGGTWVYTFTAPDGTYLMSIELYRGMLVRNDGMYYYSDE